MNFCPNCGTHLNAAAADMSKEKLTTLFDRLRAAVDKIIEERGLATPIALQLTKSILRVEKRLRGRFNLTGEEAVRAFLEAVHGEFMTDFAVIKGLVRKHPQIEVDRFSGFASLPKLASK